MAQPVEPVDRKLNRLRSGSTHNSTGRGPGRPLAQPIEGAKKLSLSSKTVVQPVKVESQPVEVQLRLG